MDQQIFVYVDLDNMPYLIGRLWLHVRKRVESATFRYDEGWLQNPERFALEPALQMDAAPHHTAQETACSAQSEIQLRTAGGDP